jgi:murein DD-endopeptidase MepM/ murein hydrolase activator NlpD
MTRRLSPWPVALVAGLLIAASLLWSAPAPTLTSIPSPTDLGTSAPAVPSAPTSSPTATSPAVTAAPPAGAEREPVYPLPGEGMIRLLWRVCGHADNWYPNATANGITPGSGYVVPYGEPLTIDCLLPPQAPPAAPARQAVAAAAWAHPLPGACRPPYGGGQYLAPRSGYQHQGIDLGGIEHLPVGTPVRAVAAGTVTYAGYSGNAGNQVQVDHGNGVRSKTNHLSSFAVWSGQHVSAGQPLGGMGATGNASGAHAHIEVWQGGSHVDPVAFLRARGVEVAC